MSFGGGGGGQQDWTAANISKDVARDIWETYKEDYTQWENDMIAAATDTSTDMNESDTNVHESVNSSFRQGDNAFSMANARMGVSIDVNDQAVLDRSSNLEMTMAKADSLNRGRSKVNDRALQLMAGGVNAKNGMG
ncbi:MAG: hypothetical protein HOD58_17140 [Gammaproteobacteria bacterium]|nr:hypothetical protein [Gammaproteobacteria bacterium]